MTVRDQAVWCEVAMHTLSRSILLPPLDEAVDPHASLTTKVLPHIISLRNFQRNIESTFMHNREKRNKAWPVPDSVLSPSRTVFLVKSAVVFSKCGEFEKAEQTLRDVMRLYHPLLRILDFRIEHVILAASDCLWEQCRINEAANLREQAFNVVLQDFGPDHPETLWLMGILGESRFEQGLFAESIEILTKAMVGMKKLSDSNSDTFHVHEQLGTRLRACSRLEDAKICHETAVAGFKRCLGENDERTLIATEELAKTYKALGTQEGETNEEPDREYLQAAYKHASFVVEQRKKLLGNDHPRAWRVQRTLCNVRAAMGQVDEAERMYSLIVPLAAHQLGENHLDVIRLKNHQAYILLLQNRYHEVETILLDISKLERYYRASSTGEHPERWDALLGLVECYQKQGKIDSSLAICKKLLMAMGLNQQGRPQKDTGSAFSGMVLSKTAELLAMKNSSVSDNSTSVIPQSQ